MNSIREQLKGLMGDGYKGLLEAFLSDSPKRLDKMLLATQENDMESLANEAHALKGSSSNLGAQQLASVCSEIEKLARNNSIDGLSTKLDEAKKDYQELEQALEKELSS